MRLKFACTHSVNPALDRTNTQWITMHSESKGTVELSIVLSIHFSYRIVYGSDVIPHQPPCKKDMNIPPNEEGARYGSIWLSTNGFISRACSADDHDESYHHGTEIWSVRIIDSSVNLFSGTHWTWLAVPSTLNALELQRTRISTAPICSLTRFASLFYNNK